MGVAGEPPWLTADESAMWLPFVVSSLHLFSRLDDELKREFDITHLDYGILSQLSFRPDGRLRMADLADRFGVARSNMTYRVSRLERLGFVERCPVDTDGRGVAATLTEAGRRLLERAAPTHVDTVRRLFVDRVPREHHPVLTEVFARLAEEQERDARA